LVSGRGLWVELKLTEAREAQAETVCPLKAMLTQTPSLTGTQVVLLLGKAQPRTVVLVVLVVLLALDRRQSQAGSDQTQRLVLEPTQQTVQPVVPLLVQLVALPRVHGNGRERRQRRKKKSARPRRLRRSGRRIWRRE
jgi:hypothetical protein